jgi:hypothetical protein
MQYWRSHSYPAPEDWRGLQGESARGRGLRDGVNCQRTRPGRGRARRQLGERHLCTPWGDVFQGLFLAILRFLQGMRGGGRRMNDEIRVMKAQAGRHISKPADRANDDVRGVADGETEDSSPVRTWHSMPYDLSRQLGQSTGCLMGSSVVSLALLSSPAASGPVGFPSLCRSAGRSATGPRLSKIISRVASWARWPSKSSRPPRTCKTY